MADNTALPTSDGLGDDMRTVEKLSLSAKVPVSLIDVGGTANSEAIIGNSGVGMPCEGMAAENAAVVGDPILIGGRYDTAARTLGNGDLGAIALAVDGAVHINDGGNTITVDGTVTANLGAVDNAVLDAIAASVAGTLTVGLPSDAATETTLAAIAGYLDTEVAALVTAVQILDNIVSGSEAQVDIVAALPAGTNNIGDVDVLTLPDSISGPGSPVVDSYTSVAISAAANTADQSLVAAPGVNKQIWVYGFVGTADTGDGSISLQDSDNVAGSGVMPVVQNGGFAVNPSGNFSMPWLKVATNKALEIDTVTCGFKGVLSYAIVDVS